MPPYPEIPQTPPPKALSRYDVLIRNLGTSSSRSSDTDEHHGKHKPAFSSTLCQRDGTLTYSKLGGVLPPPSFDHDRATTHGRDDTAHPMESVDLSRLSPRLYRGHGPEVRLIECIGSTSPAQHSPDRTKYDISTKLVQFWAKNRSSMLVVISSFFGAVMTVFTKLLERGGSAMGPLQILFLRMATTLVVISTYLYWKEIPDFPLGRKGVRWLLLVRGLMGFVGILGIWSAIKFLPLADATVITFLTPSMMGLFSAMLLHRPFTRKEQLASLIALIGVIFIARPAIMFGSTSPPSTTSTPPMIDAPSVSTTTDASTHMGNEIKAHHFAGIMLALLSAVGGAGALVSIQSIGDRAHVLTTTNYFAFICTVISASALTVAPLVGYKSPGLRFVLPHNPMQWILVLAITVFGFLTQIFMTIGLSSEEASNKAPAMVYTSMLWTAGFDRWVFGHEMYWTSFLGCALIIGSAVWVVLLPKTKIEPRKASDVESAAAFGGNEAAPMIADEPSFVIGDSDDEEEPRTSIEMRPIW